MGGWKISFGKHFIQVCIFMFAPLLTMMILPSALVDPTTADDQTIPDGKPSSEASLSATLSYKIKNYLPTDEKDLRVLTDNENGYKVHTEKTDEKEIWSFIPEYAENKKTIADISTMQEMTSAICDATPTPKAFTRDGQINDRVPEATLRDMRDNASYTVRKLADGKCWMAQNLRFNFSAGKTLTPSDTDVKNSVTLTSNTQTEAGEIWSEITPDQGDPETPHSYNSHILEYGNYYNWYAATAGSGTYYMSDKLAEGSICPKGWKLPSAGGRNSFRNLLKVYNLSSDAKDVTLEDLLTDTPISFAVAGDYYNDGVVAGQGEWGDYWTAEAANIVAASFDIEEGQMTYNHKSMGFAVRCVNK
ncbi:hypothetical protein IJJ18_01865 [Candidatus Saccharibacteria bacterium]|nr:hypothetical protein [Candidatus Saccharibacteria bacterium]